MVKQETTCIVLFTLYFVLYWIGCQNPEGLAAMKIKKRSEIYPTREHGIAPKS